MGENDLLRLVPYTLAPRPLPADRSLPGPRYDLLKVQKRVVGGESIFLVTEKCRQDVLALRWTNAEVAEVLHALEHQHYRNSSWCETGVGRAVDCDAYAIDFDIRSLIPSPSGTDLYVKFGFTMLGKPLLIISCHS